jgi:hypothetical protein
MSKLAALLRTAEKVGARNSKGGQDTELAHINRKESALLKLLGGSGRVDPDTKLRHFDDDGDGGDSGASEDSGYSGDASQDSNDSFSSFDGISDTSTDNSAAANQDASDAAGAFSDLGWGNEGLGAPGAQATEDQVDAIAAETEAAMNAGTFEGATEAGFSNEGLGSSDSYASELGAAFGDPGATGNTADAGKGPGLGTWDFSFNLSPQQQAEHEANVNQSINAALGYDTGAGFSAPGGLGDILGFNEQAKAEAARAAAEHEAAKAGTLSRDEEAYVGPGSRATTTPAAIDEYNSLGWQGALTGNPWGFVDTEGQSHTNWGSVANDAAAAYQSPAAAAIAASLGLGPAYGIGSAAINAAKGNYTPAAATLGSLLGGPAVGAGIGALGNLVSGTPGNTIAGLGSGYLNSVAPGLGDVANISGLTGYAASGINSGFQGGLGSAMAMDTSDPMANENLTTDVNSDSMPSYYVEEPTVAPPSVDPQIEAPYVTLAEASPEFTSFGGGGSGSPSYSMADWNVGGGGAGNEFLGSKKKTRYLQSQLMQLLGGGQNAN